MAMQVNNGATNAFLDQLRHAACLNGEGVAALSHCDPRGAASAMTSLRHSLHILQVLSNAANQVAPPPPPMPIECPRIPSSDDRVPMLSVDSFYVCDQPKLFLPSNDVATVLTQLPVFSVVVVFNLALATHRRALETKKAKYFRSALRLYQNGAQMCSMLPIGGHHQDILKLHMAILNNVVLVQNELVQLEGLQNSMRILRHVLGQLSVRFENISAQDMEVIQQVHLNAVSVNALAPASAA